MKLLAVLIVLAVSCTEALLRRQLSPETGVGKLTPEQRTVGINDQKKEVKPAAENKGGKPSPGSSDKKKEVTPAVDICETELNAAGDFPNKLGYTPTPACCENTMYVQARKSSKGFISTSKDAKCKDAGRKDLKKI